MLEVRNVTKIYNPGTLTEQRLFEDFSLTVEDGQFVAIVGSNGSGKTSLLNIICGSIPIEGGDVLVGGQSISKLKDYQRYATMGRVYQDPAAGTCPNLTMLENLSLADNDALRRQLLHLADLGFLDQDNCRAAVDLLLRSRLTEATAFLLDYCNRRWPRQARDAGADFLDTEFAL